MTPRQLLPADSDPVPASAGPSRNDLDLAFSGVAAQAEAIRSGDVSSADLVELCLSRIAVAQPRLNAFRTVLADEARAAAADVDAAHGGGSASGLGPLAGVPIAIKDNALVAGQRALIGTGSPQPVSPIDDPIVAALRSAGAIPIGLTHLPELALWAATESRWHGVSRNPWNLDVTPGGSSGGSAAAVAAGLVPAAHATDGLGSIRIPASACGLVGLKPTHGLLPSTGSDLDHWLGMSHSGFVTRTIRDTVALLDALLPGSTYGQPLAEPRSLRVAISAQPWSPFGVDGEIRATLDAGARLLESCGHRTARSDPPYGASLSLACTVRYLSGMSAERARLASPQSVEPRTHHMASIGATLPPSAGRWARRVGEQFGQRMLGFFAQADLLLTPTMPILPVRAGEVVDRGMLRTMQMMLPCPSFTGPWNACGFPAMSLPIGVSAGGIPIGLQLIGPPRSEPLLLAVGAQLESATGWAARRPPEVGDRR